MSKSIKLVIFNHCFLSVEAEAVTNHSEYAIGINKAVYDDATREFAAMIHSGGD